MYITQKWSISKARDIAQKFWVNTQKKSLQKHLESGICRKSNAYYQAFSYFTRWSCPDVFLVFLLNTHWWSSWRVFSSWTLLQYLVLNFQKTSHISWNWKFNSGWFAFYIVSILFLYHSHWKDCLEGSLDRVLFAAEHKLLKIYTST